MRAFAHKRIPIIGADGVAQIAGEPLEESEIMECHQDWAEHFTCLE